MSLTDGISVGGRFREFFLLERAERSARSLSETQSRAMRAYYDAGMRRLRVAQDLRGPEEVQTSLSLYRQGTLLLAQAALLARDEHADVASLDVATALAQVSAALPPSDVPANLPEASAILSSTDPLLFDRMPVEAAAGEAEKLESVAEWLASRTDPRSRSQIRVSRVLRLGVTVAVALGLLVWVIVRVTAPVNLAKGKTVAASSVAFASSAEGVTDGVKDGRFGLHTESQMNASATIDLGKDVAISKIKVFGRGDCCFEQSIPLDLDVSSDGVAFQNIAKRTTAFSESDPWVVTPSGVVARHVRLRTEAQAFLVLSEVEVFGKAR
jgi:hypothetical protein